MKREGAKELCGFVPAEIPLDIQQQEYAVVYQIQRIVPIFVAEQNANRKNSAHKNLPPTDTVAKQVCPISHNQQHKAKQEAEPVVDHIGEVEAVPDIV